MNAPDRSNPWLGRSLGDNQRYRLDKRLGAGGMGDVFLATDTRIGQHVALKLLKGSLVESPEMRQRFEHEIAICAALLDEHIVKIMDAGVTAEGYPFYVMEYLRGETLGDLLRRERQLTVDRTVKIISQVCNGLLLAHHGVALPSGEYIETVVHRDLKPDNIFLQPTDLGEWVKIVDFGIAKIRYKEDRPQTLTHNFLGTLRYASPEQMMGDRDLDGRSDIYSLGVILYEMLSGADPFGFNIQPRISEASWVIAHTSGQPIPLRSQPGCEHISPALAAIILRCLEKTPEQRFGSVAELNLALQAAIISPTSSTQVQTSVQPRPVVISGANDETIPKPIVPPSIVEPEANVTPVPPAETISRSSTPLTPVAPPDLDTTNARHIPAPTSNSTTPHPASQTISRSSTPLTSTDTNKTPWLKLVLGSLLGLGLAGGAYLFTQPNRTGMAQSPLSAVIKLVDDNKFQAAIDSAQKIPQSSPDYATAQTLSGDTASLVTATKLANQGKLKEAIELLEKIPSTSPIYKKVQAYLQEWQAI